MTIAMPAAQTSLPARNDPGDYRILIACEHTGAIRDAFRARGFTGAISCDMKPADTPGPHIQGDVAEHLEAPHDLVIAHPPCTYLAASGIRHWHTDRHMQARPAAIEFFNRCLAANAPLVAVENPRMPTSRMGGAIRPADQCLQPWQFGHPYTKLTCFWLKGLPRLRPTHAHTRPPEPPVKSDNPGALTSWTDAPGSDRYDPARRAATFAGIATAIADQWGSYLLHQSRTQTETDD